jgi:hypothetical protein
MAPRQLRHFRDEIPFLVAFDDHGKFSFFHASPRHGKAFPSPGWKIVHEFTIPAYGSPGKKWGDKRSSLHFLTNPSRDRGFRTATLRGGKRLSFGGNRAPKILESFDPDKEDPIPFPYEFHTISRVNAQKFPDRFRDRDLSLAGNHAGHVLTRP